MLTLKFLLDIIVDLTRRPVNVRVEGSDGGLRMDIKIWKWSAYE